MTWVRLTQRAELRGRGRASRSRYRELGPLTVDIAYGGNFYAIVEPQGGYAGLDDLGADRLASLGRDAARAVARAWSSRSIRSTRPSAASATCCGPTRPGARARDGRNAVFYGEKAHRPLALRHRHLGAAGAPVVARESSRPGERFVHESYIGSRFIGRVEAETTVGDTPAIIPSIEGSAWPTGFNQIWVDEEDPFWRGFSVV